MMQELSCFTLSQGCHQRHSCIGSSALHRLTDICSADGGNNKYAASCSSSSGAYASMLKELEIFILAILRAMYFVCVSGDQNPAWSYYKENL